MFALNDQHVLRVYIFLQTHIKCAVMKYLLWQCHVVPAMMGSHWHYLRVFKIGITYVLLLFINLIRFTEGLSFFSKVYHCVHYLKKCYIDLFDKIFQFCYVTIENHENQPRKLQLMQTRSYLLGLIDT